MKYQKVQPVQVWVEGSQKNANYLGVEISYDNMVSRASFLFRLLNIEEVNSDINIPTPDGNEVISQNFLLETPLTSGYVEISGQDYIDWGITGDPNQEAIVYVAGKLNLVIDSGISS